jgi:hypothetical protein
MSDSSEQHAKPASAPNVAPDAFRTTLAAGRGLLLVLSTVGPLVVLSCSGAGKSAREGDGGGGAVSERGGASGTSQGGSGAASGGAAGDRGGTAGERGGSAGDGGSGGDPGGTGGRDTGAGTVTGVVTTELGHSPNENAFVVIGSATAWTDAEGRFEIADVPAEYDLVLIVPTESYVLVARSLTERTVRLRAPGYEISQVTNLAGVVRGGVGARIPDDCFAAVAFVDAQERAFTLFGPEVLLDASDASYAMDVIWMGSESVSGLLHGLQYRFDELHRPIAYDAFGTKPLELIRSGTLGLRDGSNPATTVELEPVASRPVSGAITVPSGFIPWIDFAIGPFRLNGTLDETSRTYSIVLPTGLETLPITAVLRATRGDDISLESSSTMYVIEDSVNTLDLSVSKPPVSILPENGVTGVGYDTRFSWEPQEGSVSVVSFAMPNWRVEVITSATSANIPDLTAYGVSHAPGSEGLWAVANQSRCTSVEACAEYFNAPHEPRNSHGGVTGSRKFSFGN